MKTIQQHNRKKLYAYQIGFNWNKTQSFIQEEILNVLIREKTYKVVSSEGKSFVSKSIINFDDIGKNIGWNTLIIVYEKPSKKEFIELYIKDLIVAIKIQKDKLKDLENDLILCNKYLKVVDTQ